MTPVLWEYEHNISVIVDADNVRIFIKDPEKGCSMITGFKNMWELSVFVRNSPLEQGTKYSVDIVKDNPYIAHEWDASEFNLTWTGLSLHQFQDYMQEIYDREIAKEKAKEEGDEEWL